MPIALNGRVYLKVSTENGSIKIGDAITSSSIPGVGMRATGAGRVVGIALESFDIDGVGKIMVFVNPHFYDPDVYLADDGSLIIANQGTESDPLFAVQKQEEDGSTSIVERIGAFAKVVAANITSGLLNAKRVETDELVANSIEPSERDLTVKLAADGKFIIAAVDEATASPRIVATFDSLGNATFSGTLTADKIRANQIEGLEILTNKISSLSSNVATLSANLDNFFSSGSSVLGDRISPSPSVLNLSSLNVEGLATVSGNFRVKGDSLIEGILNVVDTITTQNVIVTNIANFFGDVVFKGNVSFFDHPTFNKDTAGIAVIKKGKDTVEVKFDSEYENTPIVNATLTADQTDLSQGTIEDVEQRLFDSGYSFVVSRRTKKGFTIVLNNKATEDVTFSWVAIAVADLDKVENILPSEATPTPPPAGGLIEPSQTP